MKVYDLTHEEALALIEKVHEIVSGPYPNHDVVFNYRYIMIQHLFERALIGKVHDLPPAP